jgi:hypothetical protein
VEFFFSHKKAGEGRGATCHLPLACHLTWCSCCPSISGVIRVIPFFVT